MPLDGKKEHEPAADVALALAPLFSASVLLALAAPRAAEVEPGWQAVKRLLPSASRAVLDLSAVQGKAYLDMLRGRVEAAGVLVSSLLVRGEPQKALQRVIQREKIDLVILSTHGRTGLDAFLEGSVAPRIALQCRVPIIMVPAIKND